MIVSPFGLTFSPLAKSIIHGLGEDTVNRIEELKRPLPVRIEGLSFDQLDKIISDLEKDLEMFKKLRSEKLEKELEQAETRLSRLKELKGE